MPQIIRHLEPGDEITDGWLNGLVDEVNALMNVRGDGVIAVTRLPGSILLKANLPPTPRPFLVVQDTPDGQCYVTAHWLRWDATQNIYTTDSQAGDQQIYATAAGLSSNSYTVPNPNTTNDPTTLPFYGNSGTRIPSRWAKKGFRGDARWDAGRGGWVITWIEHVARFINFSYGGSNQTYTFAQPDTNLTVTQSWDGLDPTKTTFGTSNKTNQIAIVNAPDGGYQIKSGDSGTAVCRDDLNNASAWQYQIIDGDVKC